CALNPETMQSKNYHLTPAKKTKKIAIIGGGIGGMEAAIVCAKRGHSVTLYEKSDKLGANDCGLHATDTAADDGDLFRLLGGGEVIVLGLHRFGVQRTTRQSHRVGKILRVGMPLGRGEIEATRMTANTGLNILQAILDQLGDPLGIGEELAGNAHRIDLPCHHGLSTHIGFHTAGANNGNIYELFNMCHILQIAVLRHIHRRMRPIPAVISTVIGIQHVISRILQILCGTLGFCHCTTNLNIVFAGHGSLAKALHLGLDRVTQGNGIILTASLLDGADDLGGKAIAILKASAIFIGTLVEKFNGKLIQQISFVHSMHLNAVNTCIAAELGSFGKGLDDLVDLFHRHFGANDIMRPTGRLRAGRSQLMRGIDDRLDQSAGEFILVQRSHQLGDRPRATHARSQLNEQLCPASMDFFHKYLEFLKHFRILPKPLPPKSVSQRGNAGNDQTDIVFGSLQKQRRCFLIEMASAKLKPAKKRGAAHGAHDNAVFDLHIADFPRRE
ncbi:MAG: NAD(P)-binding protein, partial [Clostridia bacterium]|nr:NAD(P)-binding protein [Clostridia bacterium]